MEVGAPKQASEAQEKLLDQEPEVVVGAPKLTSKAREKLLVQEPDVDVGAPKLASKSSQPRQPSRSTSRLWSGTAGTWSSSPPLPKQASG